MNTPSPEQTQKEGLYEHYQGSNLRWYVRLGTMGPVYEYQFEHEAINARICLNAAFQAGVAHVQAQAAPVQPAYVYSKDYDALYELLCKGGEAMGMMQGYLERVPVQITKTWTFLGDKNHFLAEGVRCNLEWVAVADGEKERSGPSQ